MGEGKALEDEDSEDPALRIALRTTKLLETRRKKEAAKKMAKLMKNFNYDLLRGTGQEEVEVEAQPQGGGELDLDETEAERLRKLQEMSEEMAAGSLLTQETGGCPKYEAPLITLMRSVETVNELYNLADQIVPLSTTRR